MQTYVRFPLDTEQPFGNDGRVSRTHVRRHRAALLLVVTVLTLVAAGGVADALGRMDAQPDAMERRYVVVPGDTLWSIAATFAGDRDPRSVIDALERTNGIEAGNLKPGQLIIVPAA